MVNNPQEIEVRWDGSCYVLQIGEARFAVDPDLVSTTSEGRAFVRATLPNCAPIYDELYTARIKTFALHETRIFDLSPGHSLHTAGATGFAVVLSDNGRCMIAGPAKEIGKISVKSDDDPAITDEERRETARLREEAKQKGIGKAFYQPAGTVGYQWQNLRELLASGSAIIDEIRLIKEPNHTLSRWNELARRAEEKRLFEREAYERGAQVTISDGHIRILSPREPSEKKAWNERTFDDLTISGIYKRLSDVIGQELPHDDRLQMAKELYARIYIAIGDEITPPDGRGWKEVGLKYLREILYREEGGKRSPREAIEKAREIIQTLQPAFEKLQEDRGKTDEKQILEETGRSYIVEQTTENLFNPLGNYFNFDDYSLREFSEDHDNEELLRDTDAEERSLNLEEPTFTPAEFEHYQVTDADKYGIFPELKLDEYDEDYSFDNYLEKIKTYESLIINDPFFQLEVSSYLRQYIGEAWGYGKAPTNKAVLSTNELLERLGRTVAHSLQTRLSPEQLGINAQRNEARLEALVGSALVARQLAHDAERRGDVAQLYGAHLIAQNLLNTIETAFGKQRTADQLARTLALNPHLKEAARSWPALDKYPNLFESALTNANALPHQQTALVGIAYLSGQQEQARLNCSTLLAAIISYETLENARTQINSLRPLAQAIASTAYAQNKENDPFWREVGHTLETIASTQGLPKSFIQHLKQRAALNDQLELPVLDAQERASISAKLKTLLETTASKSVSGKTDRFSEEDLRKICERLSLQAPLAPIRFLYEQKLFAVANQKIVKLTPSAERETRPALALFDAFRKWMVNNKVERLTQLPIADRQRAFNYTGDLSTLYRFLHGKGFPGHLTKEQLWQFYQERLNSIEKQNTNARRQLQNDPRYQMIRDAVRQADTLAPDKRDKRIKFLAGMIGGYIKPNGKEDQQLLNHYETLCKDIPQAKREIYALIENAKAAGAKNLNLQKTFQERFGAPIPQNAPQPTRAATTHPFVKLFDGLARVETLRRETNGEEDALNRIAQRIALEIKSNAVRNGIAYILEGGTDADRQLAAALRNASKELPLNEPISFTKISPEGQKEAIKKIMSLVANPNRLQLNEPGEAFVERTRLAEALAHASTRLDQLANIKENSPAYRVNGTKLEEALQKAASAYDNLKSAKRETPPINAPKWFCTQIFGDVENNNAITQNPLFQQLAETAKLAYERNCANHLTMLLEETFQQGSFERAQREHAQKGNDETVKEFKTLENLTRGIEPIPERTDLILSEEAREAYMVCSIGQACRNLLPDGWTHIKLNEKILDQYANSYTQRIVGNAPIPQETKGRFVELIKKEITAKNELCAQVAKLETLLVTAYTQRSDLKLQQNILKDLDEVLQTTARRTIQINQLASERAATIDALKLTAPNTAKTVTPSTDLINKTHSR